MNRACHQFRDTYKCCKLFQAKTVQFNKLWTYLTAFTKAVYINITFEICTSLWILIQYLQQVIMSVFKPSIWLHVHLSLKYVAFILSAVMHQKWLRSWILCLIPEARFKQPSIDIWRADTQRGRPQYRSYDTTESVFIQACVVWRDGSVFAKLLNG